LDALEKLIAVEEIRQLKARYYRCMDTKDWEGLAKVFAPDAVFDLREVNSVRHPLTGVWDPPYGGEEAVYRGHAAVLKMIYDAVHHLITVHHGHMSEIEIISPDTARAVWAMEDKIRNAPGETHLRMHGTGHYHDTYVKLASGWAIQTTKITRLMLDRE
jgi:SnoaL-like domain